MRYLTYGEAVFWHIWLMRRECEVRYGVFQQELIASALARPQHAAVYENADLIRQGATLCFGLVKNHPWHGGNKRTATFLTELFLKYNGLLMTASATDTLALVLAIEADRYDVDKIEAWYRRHTQPRQ